MDSSLKSADDRRARSPVKSRLMAQATSETRPPNE